jgi:hypothetical protein
MPFQSGFPILFCPRQLLADCPERWLVLPFAASLLAPVHTLVLTVFLAMLAHIAFSALVPFSCSLLHFPYFIYCSLSIRHGMSNLGLTHTAKGIVNNEERSGSHPC